MDEHESTAIMRWNAYLYEGTDVLRNLDGIRDALE